jgi:hypothetical protein
MKLSAHLFLSPPEELSEEHLTSLDFGEMKDSVQRHAPVLWRVLRQAAYTPAQTTRNKHKDPDMVCLELPKEKAPNINIEKSGCSPHDIPSTIHSL